MTINAFSKRIANYKNCSGFTLLEIMMAVAVLGIFLSIVYSYLNHNQRFLNKSSAEDDSFMQARIAMYRLTYDLQSNNALLVFGNIIRGTNSQGYVDLINWFDLKDPSGTCVYKLDDPDNDSIGQLKKNGNVIADRVKISFAVDDPNFIKITVESFTIDNLTESTLKLYTVLRRDRRII